MLLGFVNFLRGTLKLEITGGFPERFINICAARGVPLWDVRRVAPDVIHAHSTVKGFRAMRKLAKKTFCRVHILKKRGAPFVAARFSGRYALWGGLLLFLAALYTLTKFVWSVDVSGYDKIDPDGLLKQLESVGVRPGAYIPGIRSSYIKDKMLLLDDRLAWLAVNIKGSRAFVEVRERTEKPEIIPADTPCDIVATKTGIIIKMDVLNGSAQTGVGRTVMKGELLVSGTVTSELSPTRYVHAMADVTARTWYEAAAKTSLSRYTLVRTGKKTTRLAIVFGKTRINLYFGSSISYAEYDKISQRKDLTLPGDLVLPLALVSETYYEANRADSTPETEKLKEGLSGELIARIKAGMTGGEIVSQKISAAAGNGVYTVTLSCECRERIGRETSLSPPPA